MTERMRTFVRGFDDVIEGGIPSGQVVIISGTPGAMKSSLAYSVLYRNAKDGRRCIYISLEQTRPSLVRQMTSMGMDPRDVEGLVVIDVDPVREVLGEREEEAWLDVFKSYVTDLQVREGFDILAIDSIDVLMTLAGMHDRRTDLYYLFEWLRGLGSTVLLISESVPERMLENGYDEGYLADAVIGLRMQTIREVEVQRRIRCLKMRETRHDPSYFSLLFDDGTFRITKALSE